VLEKTNDAGFFSTNRKGGRGSDDIWSLKLPPLVFTLQGVVKDDSTKQVMKEVVVKITGSDGSSYIDYTDENGKYFFNEMQILPNTTYEISATHKGYFTEKGKETTVGIQRNKDLEHDFFLRRIPDKPIELPEILYDFAKWDLKPQYQDSLNGLIQTLKDNPRLVIELASHTDARASLEYNDTLSQKRAQSVVDYLIEKGIAPARLVAKGYGERIPKVLREKVVYPGKTIKQGTFIKQDTVISGVELDKGLVYSDIVIDSVVFEKGTELNEEFIESLDTKREKELAHQLNRRTEFRVIRENYVPKENKDLEIPEIEIINNEGRNEEQQN
jgi:peptidoglycan-associated lipoprotein